MNETQFIELKKAANFPTGTMRMFNGLDREELAGLVRGQLIERVGPFWKITAKGRELVQFDYGQPCEYTHPWGRTWTVKVFAFTTGGRVVIEPADPQETFFNGARAWQISPNLLTVA